MKDCTTEPRSEKNSSSSGSRTLDDPLRREAQVNDFRPARTEALANRSMCGYKKGTDVLWIKEWIDPFFLIQQYDRQTDRHMLAVLASLILGQILHL